MKTRFAAALLGLACIAGPVSAQDKLLDTKVDFRKIVRKAKAKVFPAVVFIKCIRESMESGKKASAEVSGSGAIISATGEVLTNWHVVDKAKSVRCQLADGTALKAKVIGSDKPTDLALIQLELPKGSKPLPYAHFGDSDVLTEGDFVMAMGAPFGLNRSVSIGIISCTSRYLPESSEYSRWLQTDAQISPGNSGGPLVNTQGLIVGVNTRGGGNWGFAVPSSTVKIVVPLLRGGAVKWSWTGLQLQPLRDFNKDVYFEGDSGVIVAETDPGSPARRAGLQPRDRIIKINGKPTDALTTEALPDVRRVLGLLAKGKEAVFTVIRAKKELTLKLTPREKGKEEGEELDCPRWDFTVKAINQFDNADLYFYREKGVFVYGLKSPGNAQSSGLAGNDIIIKIDGEKVKTLDDVKRIHKRTLANVENKSKIKIVTERGGLRKFVVLDISRDYSKE